MNGSLSLEIGDVVAGLGQTVGSSPILCADVLDANDDGVTNLVDSISLLNYLFGAGAPPSAPFPSCGSDPTSDFLGCDQSTTNCPPSGFVASLFPAPRIGLPSSSREVVAADVDLDGNIDLVQLGDGVLELFRGLGDFSFDNVEQLHSGNDLTSLLVVDLDADTRPDLVFLQGGEPRLILGAPGGTFTAASPLAVGPFPSRRVAVGDVVGPTAPDVILLDEIGTSISVFPGLGGGALGVPIDLPLSQLGSELVIGNLDGVGLDEIIVASDAASAVVVLQADLNGSLASIGAYSSGGEIRSLRLADLNTDGFLDVAIETGSTSLRHLLGDGQSGFGSPSSLSTAGFPGDLAAVDFDGDAMNDLVMLEAPGTNSVVRLYPGTAAGGFGSAQTIADVGGTVDHLEVADLDSDGELDLLIADFFGGPYSIRGSTGAAVTSPVRLAAFSSLRLEAADLDFDDDPDLVVLDSFSKPRTYRNDGALSFTEFPTTALFPFLSGPRDLKLDFIGDDADLDALIANETALNVAFGSDFIDWGQGFQLNSAGPTHREVELSDLNGDGDLEAIVVGPGVGSPPSVGGAWVRSVPNSSPVPVLETTYATGPGARCLAIGDIDSDGSTDLAIGGQGDGIAILLGTASGQFQAPTILANCPTDPLSVRLFDMDGDDVLDLVVAGTATFGLDSGIAVALGSGGGSFQPWTLSPLPVELERIEIHDLDNDGIFDIVGLDGSVIVLRGTSPTAFGTYRGVGETLALDLAVADFDGDGDLDIAYAKGSLFVLRNLLVP